MYQFTFKPPVFVLILFQILVFSSLPTVRSEYESSVIRLPSEVCPDPLGRPISDSCPVNCFRPDPVCGVDGVTYWCGCEDARCAGAKVAKAGFCQVGNAGAVPLSAQALLIVHMVWLTVLGISVCFGVF